jgi:hypothetical protein
MPDLTIHVPPAHAGAVRDGLLHRYAGVAEALHRAAGDHAGSHDHLDSLDGHRLELGDLEAALDQLGWEYAEPAEAVVLTAHPEVLSDATHAALDDAIEVLTAAAHAYWRGTLEPGDARAALDLVVARFALFDRVQRGDDGDWITVSRSRP